MSVCLFYYVFSGFILSRQQESGKAAVPATSSGVCATPGVFPQGQPSPPMPMSSQSSGPSGGAGSSVPSTPSTDMKTSGLGVADVKEECKTPIGLGPGGLGSLPSTPAVGGLGASSGGLGSIGSAGGLGSMQSSAPTAGLTAGTGPLGFSLTLDKEETRVSECFHCFAECYICNTL